MISPEGCASILWRSSDRAQDAADALKLTAQDLQKLGVIDTIVSEPVGGAHRKPAETIKALGEAVSQAIAEFDGMSPAELRQHRRDKFLEIGRAGLS